LTTTNIWTGDSNTFNNITANGIIDIYGNATCRSSFFVDSISAKTTSSTNYSIYGNLNTSSTITLGSDNIANQSTTHISKNGGICFIGSSPSRSVSVNICNGADFSGSCNIVNNPSQTATSGVNIGSSLTNINICNTNNYARTINIASTNSGVGVFTTNTVNIGSNMSNINIGNASGNTNRTITIGNTTGSTTNQMGNIRMGNATNNLTTDYNGTVNIEKLQVGTGSCYRCVIVGNIGAGLSGLQTHIMTGAPSGMGNPIVIATIVNVGNNNYIYVPNISVTGTDRFTYRKKFYSGASIADASSESIHFVAYWL
jgi:hypothetical protein